MLSDTQHSQDRYTETYHYSRAPANPLAKVDCATTTELDNLLTRVKTDTCRARIMSWHCGGISSSIRVRLEYPAASKVAGCPDRTHVPKLKPESKPEMAVQSETDMGFIILATGGESQDLYDLLEVLYEPTNTFVIHVDAKDPKGAATISEKVIQLYPGGNVAVTYQRGVRV